MESLSTFISIDYICTWLLFQPPLTFLKVLQGPLLKAWRQNLGFEWDCPVSFTLPSTASHLQGLSSYSSKTSRAINTFMIPYPQPKSLPCSCPSSLPPWNISQTLQNPLLSMWHLSRHSWVSNLSHCVFHLLASEFHHSCATCYCGGFFSPSFPHSPSLFSFLLALIPSPYLSPFPFPPFIFLPYFP